MPCGHVQPHPVVTQVVLHVHRRLAGRLDTHDRLELVTLCGGRLHAGRGHEHDQRKDRAG